MKPVLLDDAKAPVKRANNFLVFHWPHYQHGKHSTPDTTILEDGWKLHYWWETGQTQLFHLDQDLGESKDLAGEERSRAAGLKSQLTNYLSHIDAQLPMPNPNYNPATDPALRARGNENE